jgi:hypothetical protein
MPTIKYAPKDAPGYKGVFFHISVEHGERALATFELLNDGREVDRRYLDCGEGEREVPIEALFPKQDLSRPGFEVTFSIRPGGLVAL